MQMSTAKKGKVSVVTVTGKIDTPNAPELEQQVLALIGQGEKFLAFDLAQTDYVSSAGLRVFLVALKKVQALGGTVCFAGTQPPVHQVFDASGLSLRLKLFATLDEALKSFP